MGREFFRSCLFTFQIRFHDGIKEGILCFLIHVATCQKGCVSFEKFTHFLCTLLTKSAACSINAHLILHTLLRIIYIIVGQIFHRYMELFCEFSKSGFARNCASILIGIDRFYGNTNPFAQICLR